MSLNYIRHQWEQGNLTLKAIEENGIPSVEMTDCVKNVLLTQRVIKQLSADDKYTLYHIVKAQR